MNRISIGFSKLISHDPAGRLARATVTGPFATTTQYTYDARGNRIAVNRDGTVTSAVFDNEDRILSYGDLRFTYTEHGDLLQKENLVSGESLTLTYDQRGQLTRAQKNNGQVITYTIDGEGRRLTRSINGEFDMGYMHDTAGRLIAEVWPSGDLKSHFVYATQSHSPDYMIYDGARYFFSKNHLGSILAVINTSTGETVQQLRYDEFGRVLSDTNPGFQPFGFAGGHYDFETGLVRFGARDYDAEIGRWTSKDPILLNGGQANLYTYAHNSPLNFIDADGNFPTTIDEAGECLFGSYGELVKTFQINIERNQRFIENLKRTQTFQCDTNPVDTQKSINALTKVNESLRGHLNELIQKCSFFPTIN